MYLSVSGFDDHPDLVTHILQIMPTWTACKGDSLGNGRLLRTSHWRRDLLAGGMRSGVVHENAMGELIGLLQGRDGAFAELRSRVAPRSVQVWGTYEVHPYQCTVWMEPGWMRRLADCRIEWGLELSPHDGGDAED